jgi:GDP-L-fucose synthase
MKALDPRWWKGKRVLVTGADGFIGRRVVSWLTEWALVPAAHIRQFSLPDGDLRSASDARWAVSGCDLVLHVAADVGGPGYSRTHAAEQYYNCSAIDLAIVEAARHASVGRVMLVGCSSAYPSLADTPVGEPKLFDGPPHVDHAGYGFAKRNAVVLAGLYAKQHDMSIAAIISTEVYGPGDHFDDTSQLVADLVAKCAGPAERVVVRGDGQSIGDFVFVDDLVSGLLLAAEHLPPGTHVNIGSGEGTSLETLARTVATATAFKGIVEFDGDRSSGDPARRLLDISKAKTVLGYVPEVTLSAGIDRTVGWYRQEAQRRNAAAG